MEQKSYYAIIPANVRYDKELKPNAKLLYGEITALTNEKGYCWATNRYFAELYGVNKSTISRWVNQLFQKGYISVIVQYKPNSKQIDNRHIRLSQYPIDEKSNTPIDEKSKDNNTSFNNTINNIKHIVDFLNETTNSDYKYKTKKTQDLIKARFNEDFTVKDFELVIKYKNKEWKETEMGKHLVPITLFGNKFESYLQNAIKSTKINPTNKYSEEEKKARKIQDDIKTAELIKRIEKQRENEGS